MRLIALGATVKTPVMSLDGSAAESSSASVNAMSGVNTGGSISFCEHIELAQKRTPTFFRRPGFSLMLAVTYFPADAVSSAPQA